MTKLYSVVDAAELLGIHPQQVRELIWADQLIWVNVAKPKARVRIRIEHAEIERFIKARRSKSNRVAA
jgi:Helix-turn-helix domain